MSPPDVSNDWWPELLREIQTEDPLATENVLIAEIGHPWGLNSYRHLYTALVPPDKVSGILSHTGGIGHEVDATGPHPSFSESNEVPGEYRPKFWIWAGEVVPAGLEPLVVSWTSANQTVLRPEQGFLMTYGLVPRLVESNNTLEVHWDDPSVPRYDVVIVRPVSLYDFPRVTQAFVSVHQDYLRDYATIRECSLVQVYYAQKWGSRTDEIEGLLGDTGAREFRLPGRLIDLRVSEERDASVLAQVWGVRGLINPGDSRITAGRWNYGSLEWPGFSEPISRDVTRSLGFAKVFVADTVLEEYEARPEYQIYPEHGAVSYGNQWSVSYSRRIGRDLIELEIKKLYEGTPPEVVRHWHQHAVSPPTGELVALAAEPNVATRARLITYRLVGLGERIADIASAVLNGALGSSDTVGLERQDLDYRGWWKAPGVEPITRHIPMTITEDGFLDRCGELHRLVVESIKERILRQLLVQLGVSTSEIESLRSLRLLEWLVQNAVIAAQSGLDLISDCQEIVSRRETEMPSTPVEILFIINELRLADSHRGESSRAERIDIALEFLGINRGALTTSWGTALDLLYDTLGRALEEISEILADAQP